MAIGGLKEKLLAAHRNRIETVVIPVENRKDLKEIPRRVLRDLRIVLVDHMDDVLREALILNDPAEMLGPRRLTLEYRAGQLYDGSAGTSEEPTASVPEPVVQQVEPSSMGEGSLGVGLA
jgi:ATP-dependent Lon protease